MYRTIKFVGYLIKPPHGVKWVALFTSLAALMVGATQAQSQMSIEVDDRGIRVESEGGLSIESVRSRLGQQTHLDRSRFGWIIFPIDRPVLLSQSAYSRQSRRSTLSQTQETTGITVDSDPLALEVWGDRGTYINAEIVIDGKVVETIRGNYTAINLSSYLNPGTNEIEITGNYTPANSNIYVELTGDRNMVRHETSGTGRLNQTLLLDQR
ncbi:hypothetical protein [Laspinema olomoucense]|uniref:Auto-transporter adhesin head GIN domain-containing protein n=1 Tax=Laspinema olomoucense D3b TaxID=2953688 RepID=A0ABT2N1W4_9CYAN|nr:MULTISPECIES: hypothetical protein [unclassified Laspinema]MCT7976673.1 hypothetical protein [Laspinema sp. D3b]MCT7991749.1 hypothetical protein [Laspinema sp. D3a]